MSMIRKNLINCKLIFANTSGKFYHSSCMTSFCPEDEVCPYCKRKGDCSVHAYYDHCLIDFLNNCVVTSNLKILRVICSCDATHSILPDPIIPYRQKQMTVYCYEFVTKHIISCQIGYILSSDPASVYCDHVTAYCYEIVTNTKSMF